MACLSLFAFAVAAPVDSEANLFKKLKEKRQAKMAEKAREAKPRRPVPRHRSWYRDEHKDAYLNHALLEVAGEKRDRKVVVDIERQRVYLVVDGLVAIDAAISSARRGYVTPRGSYEIREKIRSGKVSTLYHVYMPNWMRLDWTPIGMHTGDLPGYPASHGCIRLPQSVAPVLFEHTEVGTPVEVVDTWDEEGLRIPYTPTRGFEFAGA